MEFNFLSDIVEYCRREKKDMAQAMLEYEMRNKRLTREQVYTGLKRTLFVMEESVSTQATRFPLVGEKT